MGCPYYIDFTRNCIRSYPGVIQHRDFSTCESENYQKCLVHNILKSDFRCKYLNTCVNMFPNDFPDFFKLINKDKAIYEYVTKPTYQYCLSKENHVHCARYKLKEQGIEPSQSLTPDGQSLDFKDSLFKRKIVFEKTTNGP